MISILKQKFALSDQGAADLGKGILYTALSNISLMLPVCLAAWFLNRLLPDAYTDTSSSIGTLFLVFCGILILAIIFFFHYRQYTSTYIGTYEESARRRITLAEQLRMLPLSFFDERDTADLTAAIMGDCAGFEHAFSHTVPQFLGTLISTLIMCIGLVFVNPRMGLALLWVSPIAFAIILLSRRWQQKLGGKHMTAKLDLADGIQEYLETIQEIQANCGEAASLKKLDARLDAAEKSQIRSELVTACLLTSGQMFLRIGLASVIVTGNALVAGGKADLVTYILFLVAASRIYDPLSGVMANISELFNVSLLVKRHRAIAGHPLQEGDSRFCGNRYDITFEHVDFSYESGKSVLADVSFTARQGEVTALAGPSGSGKSTAAKLAARFHDINNGRILLGGTDISTIDPADLLQSFAFVFQDVILFNQTILENIRSGRQGASDEEVMAAARAARCEEFIARLPDGYQTVIGENGSLLSGGERQRLSIARALLKDAPVILLDEATASLDVDSETQVQLALSELIQGKTVLVIAHRLRTIEAANQIVVLKDGRVKECGTHEELVNQKGIYQHMAALQKQADQWNLF